MVDVYNYTIRAGNILTFISYSVDARALTRMQAMVIEVACVSRVFERIQVLVIEVRRTYLSGIGKERIMWLVDRKPYDDEDIFRGIIVEGRSRTSSPQPTGEWIKEGFETARLEPSVATGVMHMKTFTGNDGVQC